MSMASSPSQLDKSPLDKVRRKTTFARLETKSDGFGDVSMFDVKPNKNAIKPKKVPAEEFKSYNRLEDCLRLGIRPIFPFPQMSFGATATDQAAHQ